MPPLIAPVPTFRLPPLIAPLAVIVETPVNAPPLSVAVPSVREAPCTVPLAARLTPLISPAEVIPVTPVNAPPLNVAVPSVRLVTVVAPALNVPSTVVAPSVAEMFFVLSCNVVMEDALLFTFCTRPLFSSPTVVCKALTSFTRPKVELPTAPSNALIFVALSPTFFTKPVSASFTVASNSLIDSVCPLTVVVNALMLFALVATLDFKLPTVIAESPVPIVTPSAILPELIVAPVSVAPVRVVLVRVAPSIVANFASAAVIV